jgi:GNAT superfamily N-acetyltransferase
MWWRKTRRDYEAAKGATNKEDMRKLVESRHEPGLIAWIDGRPAGWCSVGPREEFVRLDSSRTLKPIDTSAVWSVVCLFVLRPFRRQGISVRLLEAACAHAHQRGARIVEGYPVVPRNGEVPDMTAWTGVPAAFEAAGFREVARPTPARAIYRWEAHPA